MDLLGKVKGLYFALEDKYYALLDKLQPKIPVYSVVDPVDKVLPSFGILLALVFSLFVFAGFSFFGGPSAVPASFVFTDSSNVPLSGVQVSLVGNSPENSYSGLTDEQGALSLRVLPGSYTLTAEKGGFQPFSQRFLVEKGEAGVFVLQSAAPLVRTRNLLIQDSENNILGLAVPLSISLSFSCQSGSPPASQTVANGTVSIVQPANCLGLSVSVSALGFISKTQLIVGDNTVIVLQSQADFEGPETNPVTGRVELYAKDASQAGISGAQAKLYKVPAAGSNVLSNQSLTDGSGFALFSDVVPGKYVLVVSKSGFRQTTSAEFQVDAGETKTINLVVNASSTRRKVLVKVLSQLNQLPVSGASVALHVQTVGGKFIEYETYTSDANGMVNQPLADFNGNTSLVVRAPNFVTRISPNTGVVFEEDTTPIPVLLDPLQPSNANGSVPNAAVVDVKAVDTLNLVIPNAMVNVFSPDANGVLVDSLRTNTSGVARFSNLPAGSYQATATTPTADGLSAKVNAPLGQITLLPITLDVGNALIEVIVRDAQNNPLADANVSIVNHSSRSVLVMGRTNAQGIVRLGAATDQTVFVHVTKTNYLPFSSVPFEVIKDNTHHISIEVGLTSATQGVDISLTRIMELVQNGGPVLAQTLVPGNSYAFHFSVRSSTQQAGWKAMARVNPNSPSSQQPADVGQILNAQSALGGVSFFTTYNSQDEFSPSGPVNSGVPAKVSLNQLGDVNVPGAWEYIVVVKINPTAVPNVDMLELRYQSKSSTQTSALYQERYTVGQPLPAQGDFSFLFFLSSPGSTNQVQVSPSFPISIEANKNYTLTYAIANLSGSSYPSANVSFGSTTPSTFTVSPSQAALPGFINNATVSGTVSLRSTSACSSSISYCSTLNVLLFANAGSGNAPMSAALNFFTVPERRLSLSTIPSFLIPGLSQVLQAVAVDNSGVPLTPLQNLQIMGQLQESNGTPIGNPFSFTGNSFGVFLAAIPASSEGQKVVVTASAAGYLSDTKTVPISIDLVLNFSQDFSCLSFVPASVSFQRGGTGSLTIQSSGCPESLSLYTSGFTENENTIALVVRNGTATITPSSPLSLGATESRPLTIRSPDYIGQYPLYVWAKYASDSEYSLVKNVDVTVLPLAGSVQCLNLSKYSFNLTNGSDAAAIQNNCNPRVPSPFLPSALLPVNGAYAHSLPPLVSPAMRSASSPLSFNWSVRVDYNASDNADFNHSDFAKPPAIENAKWYRYQVDNPASFFSSRADFSNVSPELISDSQNSGSFYLERNDLANFPFYRRVKKNLLYETTFMVTNSVTLDRVCFATSGINFVNMRIDGELVQSVPIGDCGDVPSTLRNKYFAPGPHSIQLFLGDSDTGDYWVIFRYTENGVTRRLSDGGGLGFYLSPLHGLPFSNDQVQNSPFTFGPFIGTITPATSSAQPVYLATLTGPIRDIVTNASGVEHLKQSYLQAFSDNPEVRVFVKDDDVFAQFIGIDDPAGPQNVLVENIGMSGEKYGVLSLRDYTASVSSPSSPIPLDVGVLLDSSSSLFAQTQNNIFPGSTPANNYAQSGICTVLSDLKRAMTQSSNTTVRLKFYLSSRPGEIHSSVSLPCDSAGGDAHLVLNPVSNPPGYDALLDDVNESWPLAVQSVASDTSFWQSSNRVLVVVTDNKPYGLGPQALPGAWKGDAEATLVNAAAAALNARFIRGVVWYKTPIESTQTEQFGNPGKNDAIEIMDSFASQTNGFVEAMNFSEFVPTSGASVSQQSFALSQNNRFYTRLLQHAFNVSEERIVVKLTANPASACVSESGDVGKTGSLAQPKILLNWRWNSVALDLCDEKPAPNSSNFRYCDSTQFTIALTKKLRALELAYGSDANASQRAQIPFLTNFDSYLIRDAYNSDFRSDFKDFFVNSSFTDAPSYFKDSVSGSWKDYLDPGFPNLDFTIDGRAVDDFVLPSSGFYRVQITIDWLSTPGAFFVGSSPSANIHVKFTRVANASALTGFSDFYNLPLDGLVGVDTETMRMHRDGYGIAFTGSVVDLVQTPGYTLRSYPSRSGVSPLTVLNVSMVDSFIPLNTQERGTLVNLDLANGQLSLRPSLPSPVIAEWSSNSFGQGSAYYGILESNPFAGGQPVPVIIPSGSGISSLAQWTPMASVVQQVIPGCSSGSCSICLDAGSRVYPRSVVGDSPPNSSSCPIRTPLSSTSAFGFVSSTGAQNKAYLGTVFYRVPQNNYSILLGCNSQGGSGPFTNGAFLTPNGVANNTNPSTGLDLTNVSNLEQTLSSAQTLLGMLDLMSSQWTCVASSGGKTSVYWNAPKLRDFLKSQNPGFEQLSGNACVATGSPIPSSQFWTLKEETIPLNLTQTSSAGYCPLFNSTSNLGYYRQSGLPYPAGTAINVGTATGPVTGDALSALVQYRYAPTGCSVNSTYPPCLTGAPTIGAFIPNNVCTGNTIRKWEGTPNIPP